jgi:hypothetical protein
MVLGIPLHDPDHDLPGRRPAAAGWGGAKPTRSVTGRPRGRGSWFLAWTSP